MVSVSKPAPHDPSALALVVRDALDKASAGEARTPIAKNARDYACTVDGCGRQAYAKRLCNAHYIRKKHGRPIEGRPIRNRQSGASCKDCGAKIQKHGGLNRCARHYKAVRFRIIKAALLAHFGGACESCRGTFPMVAMDFHHVGDKDASISHLIANGSVSRIAAEVAKCRLLCANCHRIVHGAA